MAVNKKDGKSVFKLAFSVKKAAGDVDATNTAYAYSTCTDCKTVAAAIQVVLVSDAGSVAPENVAVAINYQCSECETLASAYQFVFADGQELQFTKEGKARLHDLKKRFQDLKQRDDLTLEQLAVEIAAIASEVAMVVDTEVEVKKASEVSEATTTTASPPSTAPDASSTTAVGDATTTTASPDTTTTTPTIDESTTTTSVEAAATTTTTVAP